MNLQIKRIITMDLFWILLSVYVVYGTYLTLWQERIVYQSTPQDFSDCPYFVQAEKISHEGTRMYFKDNGPRIVVLYHGNYGSACDRAFYAGIFEEAGYSYLLPEYAGYSSDTVLPTHVLLKKDVEHTVDFLRTKKFSEVVVVGESIGGSFAAYHASLLPPRKLLLISPFKDLTAIARAHFWYYPTSLLVKNPFDNVAALKNFTGEVQLVHGDKDDIIPLILGQKFFEELAIEHKEMVVIKDAGHNDLFAFPETYQAIGEFLK